MGREDIVRKHWNSTGYLTVLDSETRVFTLSSGLLSSAPFSVATLRWSPEKGLCETRAAVCEQDAV